MRDGQRSDVFCVAHAGAAGLGWLRTSSRRAEYLWLAPGLPLLTCCTATETMSSITHRRPCGSASVGAPLSDSKTCPHSANGTTNFPKQCIQVSPVACMTPLAGAVLLRASKCARCGPIVKSEQTASNARVSLVRCAHPAAIAVRNAAVSTSAIHPRLATPRQASPLTLADCKTCLTLPAAASKRSKRRASETKSRGRSSPSCVRAIRLPHIYILIHI